MPSVFLKNYLLELTGIINMIDAKEFESLVGELAGAYEKQSNIFICGNGGSAATASHFACDINKGVSFGKEKRFRVICLNDSIPTIMAYSNDVSYDSIFVEQLKNFMNAGDLLIGISGSGNSGNVLNAVRYANEKGGKTFGICGYGGGRLKGTAQKSLVVNSKDMQKVEDAHLIILHCVMQWFNAINR
ncbi:MAG: SIS domain-containing protein [Nitrospirae bacterium]|nr:SIS domain-containing protein [Nitrospirota bacterium]